MESAVFVDHWRTVFHHQWSQKKATKINQIWNPDATSSPKGTSMYRSPWMFVPKLPSPVKYSLNNLISARIYVNVG